ncbi:vWA domain-containing protein [Glycomyces arizonensis]|uniref:vWA domain-containing protein n=1 Tax=Glycomyces arizonensis TaxID=256035 RepID=UPI00047D836F|nr:substrate-binding domain-containing protein [Glycomyces arizonensis]
MVFGHTRAVKSHRTGRRRKKGGSKLPVAPWILFTLVSVLVASALTAGFVTLLRAGCGGDGTYRVPVAVAPNVFSTMEDLAREWETQDPEVDGNCVGVEIHEVAAVDASRGFTGEWDTVSLGPRPIAWVPDSAVWPQWVTGTEVTADYFPSDPVVLGQSKTVLAVPEPVAEDLGWIGGQPPSWSEVLSASESGEVTIAAANPRTSTEGLQSMLNAVGDGSGGVDAAAMGRYSDALDAGRVGESAEALFSEYLESDDPASFANVFTALDYQVEDFNASSGLDYQMVPITPSGAALNATYAYMVLGAGWVSGSDAAIAGMFGDFLRGGAASAALADAGLAPGPEAEAEGAISGETVRDAVRQWQEMRRDVHLLIVVDRSEVGGSETVEYEGETVSAALAEIRLALALVDELGSTSRAGLWEFGVGAGEDQAPWRAVTESAEMSSEQREALTNGLYGMDERGLYGGGSPLFDTVAAAYDYMGEHAVEGASNVVVVLTNDGTDSVSAPTIEQTQEALAEAAAGQAVPVSVYTVGFGSASVENLAAIAEATQGAYVEAPASGGVLEQLRGGSSG